VKKRRKVRGRGAKRETRKRPKRKAAGGAPLVTGLLFLQPDGSGRLTPEALDRPDIFVPPEEIGSLRSGDKITVRLEQGRRGRIRGRLVSLGARLASRLVGIVESHRGGWFLDPVPPGPALVIDEADLAGARRGDAVEVELLEEARGRRAARARVDEVLGSPAAPSVQVEMLVRGQGLPIRFSDAALAEAEAAVEPRDDPALLAGRKDLRRITHVTIDGESARDFDDAVAAVPEADGVRVWVSIADVSRYVQPGSALDEAVRERGTSVYFPHRAIPMLPERLSNGVCSLKPGTPRFTLTCEMLVRPGGRRQRIRVYPSLVASRARLTYRQVQAALDGAKVPELDGLHDLLDALVAASRLLRSRRTSRGAVDLDLPEAEVVLGPDGAARHIRPAARFESHRLIEDLMIAANESVAEQLIAHRVDTVFRVHGTPDPKRVGQLVRWAAHAGVPITTDPETPKGLARLARDLQKAPAAAGGQLLLLRSMAQARYADENIGHFALASRAYVHFTSPIRRYPDLLVHRCLRALWRQGPWPRELAAAASRASLHERRAMEAERAVEQLMACHVARHHVGLPLEGIVVGVHRAGAFVRCREPFFEGLLPMERLEAAASDRYDVIEEEQILLGRRTGRQVRLGDKLTVHVENVDTRFRHIDFDLVDLGTRTRTTTR
jgi:ribonuclease R